MSSVHELISATWTILPAGTHVQVHNFSARLERKDPLSGIPLHIKAVPRLEWIIRFHVLEDASAFASRLQRDRVEVVELHVRRRPMRFTIGIDLGDTTQSPSSPP